MKVRTNQDGVTLYVLREGGRLCITFFGGGIKNHPSRIRLRLDDARALADALHDQLDK